MARTGRPQKVIDPKEVETLAAINCTVEEIAAFFDVDKRTIERRFMPHLIKGRQNGKSSLRRMMYAKAKEGNVTMMIWLSKQLLGYTDKVENKDTLNANVTTEKTLIILPDNGRSSKNES
jgi:hypothetical protein